VLDGSVLKSFVYDSARNTPYLIHTDLSTTPATVSAPLAVQPIPGALGKEVPIGAFMLLDANTGATNLAIMLSGNFDQISYINEQTGEQTPIIFNMVDSAGVVSPGQLICDTNTKDCDTIWTTAAVNPANGNLYFQAESISDDMPSTYIYVMQQLQSKITGVWYPYQDALVNMNFGYSGYQW